uniref:Mce/MlaD domain-containing protein n=1 Tax=Polysiphonia infestans TaxID=2006978 RepID=A0A1Z1MEI5_9FLOR|nr:hypothetical protein [Polysiphonia infestans]ARW64319.1 hypothetical protein [Polysiphonia infestans]
MQDLKKIYNKQHRHLKIFFSLLIFIAFIILSILSFISPSNKKYSLFVEFDDAYGLKEGTPVTYKGVNIGLVSRITVNTNKVVVLLTIKSSTFLIPRNVLFEANQIGLFNDIILSITPRYNLIPQNHYDFSLETINNSIFDFIPNNSYIKGYKGINYNDLIRSTTRISQRFDDPRFFSLFYLLLKNTLYLSDEMLILVYNSSIIFQIFIQSIELALSKYLL